MCWQLSVTANGLLVIIISDTYRCDVMLIVVLLLQDITEHDDITDPE